NRKIGHISILTLENNCCARHVVKRKETSWHVRRLHLLAADHLLLVVLAGKSLQGWLDDASAEPEDEMEGRLLLDVVVGKGAAVLQLLAGEDQPLLVRRDPLLVLDLGLDIVDGIAALNLEGDGLPREGLDEDLH
uniref:Uncharacterized protein n=1 Tax=Aegilops tauschii subsp. strangulata TaxID=200361 RepID=A0A453IJM5_AEGTS